MLKKVLVLLLIATFVNAPFLETSFAERVFKFSGRGWGHGLGLSQYGAKGYAERGRNFKQILLHFYKGTELSKLSSRVLRILIASGRSQVNFSAKNDFKVYSEPLKKTYVFKGGHNYRATIKSGRINIKDMTNSKNMGNYTQPLRLSSKNTLKLLSSDDNGFKNNYYRGWLRLLISSRRLSMVNYVNSEQYLYGVVPREMPTSWTMEAVKAQAVAARSYSLTSLKKNTFFDLYATVYSQVYGGYTAETSRGVKAVNATRGVVITYKRKTIQAFYHSSSGGYTENNENVWGGGSPIPWLRAVRSPYEGRTAYWPSSYSFSSSYIQSRLGRYSAYRTWGVKGKLKNLVIAKRGASPRVLKVKIVGTGGNSYITGAKLRTILGLRSTWFYINGENDSDNNDTTTALSINASAKIIRPRQWLTIYGRIIPRGKGTLLLRYKRGNFRWATAAKVRVNGSTYRIRVKPSTQNPYVFSVRLGSAHSRVMNIYSR